MQPGAADAKQSNADATAKIKHCLVAGSGAAMGSAAKRPGPNPSITRSNDD